MLYDIITRKMRETRTMKISELPEGDRVFTVKAEDLDGPATIRAWADLAQARGVSEGKVADARRMADLWDTIDPDERKVAD